MTDEPTQSDIVLTESEKARRRQDRLVKALAAYAGKTRRLLHRVSQLRLFGEKQSNPEWADHPLVQLVLRHRDLYEQMAYPIELAEKAVSNIDDPKAAAAAMRSLARLYKQRQDHMDAMESPLTTLQSDLAKAASVMSKMLADAQRLGLAYQALEQKERLSSRGKSTPTDDEIDALLE